jgi:hypothetical protein
MRTKLSYLGHDIPGYTERLRKAISRYGLPSGAPRAWLRDPDFQACGYLGYMQPSGSIYWQCYLYTALQAADIDLHLNLSTITILDKYWHFGERNWNFAPGKIEYQVRRALKGLNYIVMIEFEVFRNVRYLGSPLLESVAAHQDHGRLITPHIQGFVWEKFPSLAQRNHFSGGIFNAPGIKIVAVHDFPGALRYMIKPPYKGRSVFRLPNGRMIRRVWPDMNLTLHHLFLCNLHQFRYSDLTFAGGEGRPILSHAKRLWRDYVSAATHPTDHRWPMYAGLVKRRHA